MRDAKPVHVFIQRQRCVNVYGHPIKRYVTGGKYSRSLVVIIDNIIAQLTPDSGKVQPDAVLNVQRTVNFNLGGSINCAQHEDGAGLQSHVSIVSSLFTYRQLFSRLEIELAVMHGQRINR